MQRKLPPFDRILFILLFTVAVLFPATVTQGQRVQIPAEALGDLSIDWLQKGRTLESQSRWSEALAHYEEALRDHPEDPQLRQRLDLTKIHYNLGQRYGDPSFRESLQTIDRSTALDLYAEVMLKLDTYYVTMPRWRQLVNRGTMCLDAGLTRQAFRDFHVSGVSQERIDRFRQELYRTVGGQGVASRQDAVRLVDHVAGLAYERLGISPTSAILEYVCGAAGGLDDYSTYLTGNQLKDIYSQIEGNFVGLGVELKADSGALLIVHVIEGSPAQRWGITAGDRIIAVDGQSTAQLSTDQAAFLLQGVEGSYADLTLATNEEPPRRVRVRREHVEVPSVEGVRIVDREFGIGYIKLSSFQKTTSRDLDAALWKLDRLGMRGLIMDLRNNPGGLLTSSVEVADKFLYQGNIVSTRGRNPHEAFRYDAHLAGTWRVPLVVLIGGESASASEIFAAAIRQNHRGTVVGSRSYGKGSVQGIFPLGAGRSGIRLTTAKFYSPNGNPISKVGVNADIIVHKVSRPVDDQGTGGSLTHQSDDVLNAGISAARSKLASR